MSAQTVESPKGNLMDGSISEKQKSAIMKFDGGDDSSSHYENSFIDRLHSRIFRQLFVKAISFPPSTAASLYALESIWLSMIHPNSCLFISHGGFRTQTVGAGERITQAAENPLISRLLCRSAKRTEPSGTKDDDWRRLLTTGHSVLKWLKRKYPGRQPGNLLQALVDQGYLISVPAAPWNNQRSQQQPCGDLTKQFYTYQLPYLLPGRLVFEAEGDATMAFNSFLIRSGGAIQDSQPVDGEIRDHQLQVVNEAEMHPAIKQIFDARECSFWRTGRTQMTAECARNLIKKLNQQNLILQRHLHSLHISTTAETNTISVQKSLIRRISTYDPIDPLVYANMKNPWHQNTEPKLPKTDMAAAAAQHPSIQRLAAWRLSFQDLLNDPIGEFWFGRFLESAHASECLEFHRACRGLDKISNRREYLDQCTAIIAKHLATDSPAEINTTSLIRQRVLENLKLSANSLADPNSILVAEYLFEEAREYNFQLMRTSLYPKFLSWSDLPLPR